MNVEILAAIIGAGAVIIAALIAGIFAIISSKSKTNKPIRPTNSSSTQPTNNKTFVNIPNKVSNATPLPKQVVKSNFHREVATASDLKLNSPVDDEITISKINIHNHN